MTARNFGLSREARVYLKAETTYKTGVMFDAAAIAPHKGGAKLDWNRTYTSVVERKDTVGVSEQVLDQPDSSSFTFPTSYLKPSGTTGTEPDLAPLIKAAFGSQVGGGVVAGVVQASPAPTTTGFTVVDGSVFAVGAPIRMTSGNTSGEVAFITAISTNALTIAPDLSEAPASTDGLVMGVGFYLTSENIESLTAYHDLSNMMHGGSGIVINNLSVEVSRDGTVMISADGPGSGTKSMVGTSTLDGGINNSVTTLAVPTADADKFIIDSNVPIWATIEAEGANTEEVVAITAKSGVSLTISRNADGNGASAHGTAAVIKPWRPSVTKLGTPLACLTGDFEIDGSAFGIHTAKFSLSGGKALRESNFGESTANGPYVSGDNARGVVLDISGKFEKDMLRKYNQAADGDALAAWIKVGATAGKIVAIYAPKWHPAVPSLDEGSGQIMHGFSGPCFETSGNDEIYFGIV